MFKSQLTGVGFTSIWYISINEKDLDFWTLYTHETSKLQYKRWTPKFATLT